MINQLIWFTRSTCLDQEDINVVDDKTYEQLKMVNVINSLDLYDDNCVTGGGLLLCILEHKERCFRMWILWHRLHLLSSSQELCCVWQVVLQQVKLSSQSEDFFIFSFFRCIHRRKVLPGHRLANNPSRSDSKDRTRCWIKFQIFCQWMFIGGSNKLRLGKASKKFKKKFVDY